MRRITIALLAAAVSALGAGSSAGAANFTPGTFTFKVDSAKVGIGPVGTLPINSSTLGGQPISLTGTVAADGKLTIAKAGVVFPAITVPIPDSVITALIGALTGSGAGSGVGGLDIGSLLGGLLGGRTSGTTMRRAAVPRAGTGLPGGLDLSTLISNVGLSAGILPTGGATGAVDPNSGAATLRLGLSVGVGVKANVLLVASDPKNPLELATCGIAPLNFALTTGTATVPGKGTTLTGSAYNPSTGAMTLVGAVDTPPPGCSIGTKLAPFLKLAGVDVTNLIPKTGIPSLGAASVELAGKADFKPGAPPVTTTTTTTTVTPPPPDVVAAAVLKISKTIKVAGRTVTIKVSCSHKDCKGTVRLRGTTSSASSARVMTLGSRTYKVKAGRTTTVKVPLTKAAQKWLKKKKQAKATVVVSATGGTGAQKRVTLKR